MGLSCFLVVTIFFFAGLKHGLSFQFHVAPLQGYTDHHLRYLYRLLSSEAVLWSEMLKPQDLLESNPRRQQLLLTRGRELELAAGAPCVLQLGDNDAERLVQSAAMGIYHGYTSIDLNVGCPSAKTDANFGCSLMTDGGLLVANLVDRLAEATQGEIPVSVKCRVGVHETSERVTEDNYNDLYSFVSRVTKSGAVKDVVVHARSGILQGLSPSKNRQVPPLRQVRAFFFTLFSFIVYMQ